MDSPSAGSEALSRHLGVRLRPVFRSEKHRPHFESIRNARRCIAQVSKCKRPLGETKRPFAFWDL